MKPPTRSRTARRAAHRPPAKRHARKSSAPRAAPAVEFHGDTSVAFALGGLAGSNAHGAGFLQAALDHDLVPGMLSCTSGQILWVYRYLLARHDHTTQDALLAELRDDIGDARTFPSKDLHLVNLSLFGKPGLMRLAWAEAAVDLGINVLRGLGRMAFAPTDAFFTRDLLHTLPARQMIMKIPDRLFSDIARAFNDCSDIGIIFNTYDPVQGHEHLYLNDRARELLHKPHDTESKIRGKRTIYKSITPEAVRDGLWIYQYGFEDNQVIDGAYHRQIILDELVPAKKIFVARPLRYCWREKELPKTWPEVEDLKTEMFFDGAYRCERDKIEIVNKLFNDAAIDSKKYEFHHVEIVVVELEKQRSYLDYLFEDESVFHAARLDAAGKFQAHRDLARRRFPEGGLARAAFRLVRSVTS